MHSISQKCMDFVSDNRIVASKYNNYLISLCHALRVVRNILLRYNMCQQLRGIINERKENSSHAESAYYMHVHVNKMSDLRNAAKFPASRTHNTCITHACRYTVNVILLCRTNPS